jgi:hypothetical protein
MDKLAANADIYSVLGCLEAYRLMLFGCILFNNAHGDIIDMDLLPYACTIMATTDVLVYSWGYVVLAVTHHATSSQASASTFPPATATCLF